MFILRLNVFNFSEIKIFMKNKISKIYFINKEKYFFLSIENTKFDFNVDNSSKTIQFNSISEINFNRFFEQLTFLLKNYYLSFFFKIRFTGKGYRLQSFAKKKIINSTFGHSHKYLISLQNIKYKRINKYKYFFEFFTLNAYNNSKIMFKQVKPINKYTLRGLRITRTTIIKRKGRKSPNL